jgi:hypothetical protein
MSKELMGGQVEKCIQTRQVHMKERRKCDAPNWDTKRSREDRTKGIRSW